MSTETKVKPGNRSTGLEIAVIGMAARFPGARDIHSYWNNLVDGVESLTFLSAEEMKEAVPGAETLQNPGYVPAKGGVIEDRYLFDAAFFGYTPNEAGVMDPQIRHFHECAWHALEDAGCDPYTYDGLVGVYAGASSGFDWEANTRLSGKIEEVGQAAAAYLMDKDILSTRLSYKLDLRGPSVTLRTTCSTSLVAIHMASRALLTGECDMALAGGVTIRDKESRGYIYQEGMIESPDGRCRAFDKEAKGTVGGEGIGIVVLKRLKYALRDRDHIYAVIKGTAVNNDGIRKIGFTAPSIEGQSRVIKLALRTAGLEPESIGYIEAHGTGTPLGDPIEIEALKRAFESSKRKTCAVGSVKTNIGHLDSASGVAGFIKAVLALTFRQIPPTLHFNTPNPAIDFENSPFYVNTGLKEWKSDKYPLRAGVSSFGIGGTNAHIILEEAPGIGQGTGKETRHRLIVLSAVTETALEKATENLKEFVKKHPGINLADAAYTLQVGRHAFKHRRSMVVLGVEDLETALSNPNLPPMKTGKLIDDRRRKIFMFPGQGSQYVNMGVGLYREEPVFRNEMDRCFEILKSLKGRDIKEIIYPSDRSDESNRSDRSDILEIDRTEFTQPVIFTLEYAMARLLKHWGIEPDAMVGHSIGEYTAACLSGVFSLEDALALVVARGNSVQQLPPGSMLGLDLAEEETRTLLSSADREGTVELAAVNSPHHCTVSGPHAAIDAFEKKLNARGYKTRRLHTSHAFHSTMMEPILEEFRRKVDGITRQKPQIPFISNVTGKWITGEEAVSPAYWASHLRQTVRFHQGLTELLKEEKVVLLEVGPGRVLTTFARNHPGKKNGHSVTNLLRHPEEQVSDRGYLLDKIGEMWLRGLSINWKNLHTPGARNKISLPTYPFERHSYPPREMQSAAGGMELTEDGAWQRQKPDMADWFYIPSWTREDREQTGAVPISPTPPAHWLVFEKDIDIPTLAGQRSELEKQAVIRVKPGTTFTMTGAGEFEMDPKNPQHYERLIEELKKSRGIPHTVVHLWSLGNGHYSHAHPNRKEFPGQAVEQVLDHGYYSLLYLARALGKLEITGEIQVVVVTDQLQEVTGEENLSPVKAAIMGAVKVIPLEYPNISCRSVDIILPNGKKRLDPGQGALLTREILHPSPGPVVCIRGVHRWVQAYQPVRLEKTRELSRRFREQGVYLVTGGTGGMGFTFARHLAQNFRARLVLIARSPFPPREQWEQWLADHDREEKRSRQIRGILDLEKTGARFLVMSADVSDPGQMQGVIERVEKEFGPVNGVLHTAGVPDLAGVIRGRTREMSARVMAAKITGTLVLEQVLANTVLDFMVLFSTWGTVAYPEKFGQVAYCAANEFLDLYAYYKTCREGTFTVTINWIDWLEVGMTVDAMNRKFADKIENFDYRTRLQDAVTPEQGIEIFHRVMERNFPRVVISLRDLPVLLKRYRTMGSEGFRESQQEEETALEMPQHLRQRPGDLSTPYIAPQDKIQRTLAGIWQQFFGISGIGIRDDFFELGGDSLQAMTMVSQVQKKMKVKIPVPFFFNSPTVEKLAAYIGTCKQGENFILAPMEKREYYPLSSAQKRIYIAQQMEESGTSYNQPMVRILEGEPDRRRLEQAFIRLMERNEILRASFVMVGDEILQRVHDRPGFTLEYREINPAKSENNNPQPAVETEASIKDFIKPFDLSRAPLIRVRLIKEKENRYPLVIDLHHIVSDGISNTLLLKEVLELYAQTDPGPLRLQYKDYAKWQNQWLTGEECRGREEYWLKRFSGSIPRLDLPLDFPRPSELSYEKGDYVEVRLEDRWPGRLKALAAENGATLYMVMLAAYIVLLFKYTGQGDIVVGSPLSGRFHPDLENMVGVFLNMAALRNYPAKEKTYREFLSEVKENCLEAFENQDYPFDLLITKLGLQGSANRNPLFENEFAFQEGSGWEIRVNHLEVKPYPRERKFAKFDLHLQVVEESTAIQLRLRYSLQLFLRSTIENMLKRYIEILNQVMENPGIRLEQIETSYTVLTGKLTAGTSDEGDFDF